MLRGNNRFIFSYIICNSCQSNKLQIKCKLKMSYWHICIFLFTKVTSNVKVNWEKKTAFGEHFARVLCFIPNSHNNWNRILAWSITSCVYITLQKEVKKLNFNHLVNLAVTHLTKLETKQLFSLTLKLIKGEFLKHGAIKNTPVSSKDVVGNWIVSLVTWLLNYVSM